MLLLQALEAPPKLSPVFHQLDPLFEKLFDEPLFHELKEEELPPQKDPPPSKLEPELDPPENQSPPPQAFEAAELLLFEKRLLRKRSSARIVLWPEEVVQPDDQADEELVRAVSPNEPQAEVEAELTVHWFPQAAVLALW